MDRLDLSTRRLCGRLQDPEHVPQKGLFMSQIKVEFLYENIQMSINFNFGMLYNSSAEIT